MGNESFEQLTLFAEAAPAQPVLDGLSWSYSRRQAHEQCSLCYYNRYYGANQRTAKQDPLKQQLRFLKDLSNRHMRTGDLLHRAIKTYFQKARQGTPWDAQQLVNFMRRIFQDDQRYSQAYPDGGANPGPYPKVLLREYHYRQPDADQLCQEAEERMALALSTFATAGQYEAFRQAGLAETALIEQPFRLAGFPCPVSGKIDLAFADSMRVTVVDWKLGASDGSGDDSLQLAIYGMWALDHFGCNVEDLRICKAHLSSGDIVDFPIDQPLIAAARARIQQDIERMAALHDYGQRGITEAFTPCLQPAVCRTCAFERVCYDRD